MKSKEIYKLLASILTVAAILNPYLAFADEVSTITSEIRKETINSDTSEVMKGFLETGEVSNNSEPSNDYEVSVSNDGIKEGSIYLSNIDYITEQSSVGWGAIQKDKNVDKGTIQLQIDGNVKPFLKGLGAHADSTLVFDISKYSNEYTRFSAYLGVDYSKKGLGNGVKFTISTSIDGKTWTILKQTDVITGGNNALYVDINIKNSKYLKLYANKNGNNTSDHAIYANARLLKTDYNSTREVYTGFKTLADYDKEISAKSADYNYEYNKKIILEREFVNRVGYEIIQASALNSTKIENALNWLLEDEQALQLFIEAGTLTHGSSMKTLQALGDLYTEYKDELGNTGKTLVYKKMLLATAVAYCKEISTYITQYGGGFDASKPLNKFASMKKLYDEGKFTYQEQFEKFNMELVRTIMDARMDDSEIEWLRKYTEYKIPDNITKRLDAYNFVSYKSHNNADPALYSEENRQKWEDKYKLSEFGMTSYGFANRARLWMLMEKGGICWGISGMGVNNSEVHGIPAVNIYQPRHEAYLVYSQDNNGNGKWNIYNNVFGWAKSYTSWGGNTLTEARIPLGWGMKSYNNPYKTNGSYLILAQAALNDYDNYLESMIYSLIANSYKAGSAERIDTYNKALERCKLNLDAYDGLIENYTTSNKSSEEWVDLAKRVIDSYTYYPLAMVEALDRITPHIKDEIRKSEINILETNVLNKASVATEKEVLQADVTKIVAQSLLGTSAVNLASFSFDGENANKIVLHENYNNSNLMVRYSLDGGGTWKQTPNHIIELNQEELSSITADNDIRVGLIGTEEFYTIDIKDGSEVAGGMYNNDLENRFIKAPRNLEYSLDDGVTWYDYDSTISTGFRFTGNKTVKVRYKAYAQTLAGVTKDYTFTDSEEGNPKQSYLSINHISLNSYCSQLDSKRAAANLIDGDINTIWHNRYFGDTAFFYSVKLDEVRYISKLTYLPPSRDYNGILKSGEIYTSMDGTSWEKVYEFKGLSRDFNLKTIELPDSVEARYLKIVATETHGNSEATCNRYISGRMLNFFEDTTKEYKDNVNESPNNGNS